MPTSLSAGRPRPRSNYPLGPFWIFLVSSITFLALSNPASATLRYVTGTLCVACVPPTYDTLQNALNAASSGDTIILQKSVTECATIDSAGTGGYNLFIEGDPGAGSIPYTWVGCGGGSNTININANVAGVTFYNMGFDQPSGAGAVLNQNLHQNILFKNTYITRTSATAGDIFDFTANNPAAVTFLDSTIIGNADTNNGIYTTGGGAGTAAVYVINSVIAGATNGYGFQAMGGDTANIQNSTIANNKVGLWNNSSNPGDVVTNTIFSNSTYNFLWNDSNSNSAQVTSEESNFQNDVFNSSPSDDGWNGATGTLMTGWPASDITGINPATEFVNSAGNDFHEATGAPTIGKGQTIASITTDHDGVLRPVGAYDIGAYQYVGSVTCTPTNTFTVTNTFTSTPTYTFTPTYTWTRTYTPTFTGTNTFTFTSTPTYTFTSTYTFTFTSTPTNSFTSTSTFTATFTPTATDTAVNTNTPVNTPTNTPLITNTFTITPTPTKTSTPTWTSTATLQPVDVFYADKNLFNPSVDKSVSICVQTGDYPGIYNLRIYNTAGEHIKTLDTQHLSAPISQSYLWDGTNKYGDACSSGVYILYLIEPSSRKLKRILLVR